jgi:hypothetical protein
LAPPQNSRLPDRLNRIERDEQGRLVLRRKRFSISFDRHGEDSQEETMPNANPEAVAVEAAYGAHVQMLFKTLVANLVDEPVSGQTDRQSLDRFIAGLKIAKRAKQLALSAVVPSAGGVVSRRTRFAASVRRKTK